MEENLRRYFSAPLWTEREARGQNPLVLAYIGDAVFELFVRSDVLARNEKVSALHKASADRVKARAQAELAAALSDFFTEEEEKIFLRGRNTHQKTMAKNATVAEYRNATGFECLIGYLYGAGKSERLRAYFTEIERIWKDEG
ncbi:Mini-ribonuclease 3 [Aedoeadaptatus ivorii]|uniref:Mini-ribonuclease 3 n=1 Tax=Aedoeadaptatus ivorii TaxID=54006 RepID=A0A3S4Z4N9_9FIRM|nr:ribonuclease III domain-containing protein [Peptoniphilus ivorii]MDQ0508303.1 ribonuclease-3 family protein [Peptoniphilus ivorii]VEJ36277.1 Mini-ribonuclease 3 [Peptoniphilus ivorii]